MTQHRHRPSHLILRRTRAPCALLAALAFIGGAPEAATTAVRAGGPTGRIAFESTRDGRWNVYVANADGSAVQRITTRGGFFPSWSPDGTHLAFSDGRAVYVADDKGKAVRQLIKGKSSNGAGAPVWSPDGKQLAVDLNGAAYVVAADGSRVQKLTNASAEDPAWSPDGARLAFENAKGLFVIGADGTGQTQVVAVGSDNESLARPAWSPDGQSIAYVAYSGGEASPKLSAVRVADGAVQVLAVVGYDGYFAWSPDGSAIAYSREKGYATEIYTVPAAGGAVNRVTTSAVGESSIAPTWSPDGKWLTYMRSRLPDRVLDHVHGGTYDVAVIRPDGTEPRQVTTAFPTGGNNEDPVWSTGTLRNARGTRSAPLVSAPARGLTSPHTFYELAASGRRAALLSSTGSGLVYYDPPKARLIPARAVDVADDFYGLVATDDYVAWFEDGLESNEIMDVSLAVTSRSTGRSFAVDTLSGSVDDPPSPPSGSRRDADRLQPRRPREQALPVRSGRDEAKAPADR